MALPTSPPITMAQICAEFEVPVTTPLASFLRGGGIVPNTPQNAGVPTALPISMLQLLGAAKTPPLSASAPDATGGVFLNEPAPPSTTVNAGTTVTATGGSGSYSYSWAYVSGAAMGFTNGGGSPPGRTPSWSANVPKNDTLLAVWRCTVSDGVSTFPFDINVSLSYSTDL